MGDLGTVPNRFNIVITGNQIQISQETGLFVLQKSTGGRSSYSKKCSAKDTVILYSAMLKVCSILCNGIKYYVAIQVLLLLKVL